MEQFVLLFLCGIIGGFIAGLVGIGGGVVYVVILPIALSKYGIPSEQIAQFTIANSIFAIFFASASANYMLVKHKLFHKNEVMLISVFSIISSVLCLKYIVNTDWYNYPLFNVIVVILLIFMFYNTLRSAKKVDVLPLDSLKKVNLASVGASGGLIASLSGLGGGIVIIPLLNSLMRIDIKKASSISSGVIMLTALFMTLYNFTEGAPLCNSRFQLGYIVFPVSLSLTAGVLISSPFGVNVSRKLPSYVISYIYSVFLLVVIVRKIIEIYISLA
ncbi:MAG: sulfite exporter TauE/SafE family protein [Cytophagaceae bacterium]